ncbi:MAG: cytidine deaminase [Clostridia bacterium]|nr:cytidine deaminase [Clostridia bacterium]
MDSELQDKLLDLAYEARERSYSPYSNYKVGACLLAKSGRIYQGCNIENASYTPTICAERNAFFKAVYEGEREFEAIAVVATGNTPSFPCGVCRQVMAEYCEKDFLIITGNNDRSRVVVCTLDEMLPYSFGPKDLK